MFHKEEATFSPFYYNYQDRLNIYPSPRQKNRKLWNPHGTSAPNDGQYKRGEKRLFKKGGNMA